MGIGCAHPIDSNDIHLFKDLLALIQYPRQGNEGGPGGNAFHFTSLSPTAPKILLNVESDDCGLIEERRCACPLEGYGFTEHIRNIRSFRKLTGEGVTLLGGEMIHILEEVLPSRFGGTSLDYQLVEEEDEKGFTRLRLYISPRVGEVNEEKALDTVLKALEQSSISAHLAQTIWTQARTLRIARKEPIPSNRGKLMPLHLAKSQTTGDEGTHK